MENSFLKAATSYDAQTFNGALAHSTTGSSILDYFFRSGSSRNREQLSVNEDMSSIFSEDKELALKLLFYNRMITRKVTGFQKSEKVQKGQGQKDEFIKSIKWLEENYPDLLYNNLWLVPTVGCWKDLWYDSPITQLYHYVKFTKVFELIRSGLSNENHRALIAKYLPKIRSNKHIKTERHKRLNKFARSLCAYFNWSERDYRRFKSDPRNTAHLWQRYMCKNEWNSIDFGRVPGKALFNLVSRTGKDGLSAIQRHNIASAYEQWIESKPIAKFTGYPYELYQAAKKRKYNYQKLTYDKQFEGLVQNAQKDVPEDILKKGVLCALDTSGSMEYFNFYTGNNMALTPMDVCISLGIYFSELLQGAFKDHVIMFDSKSRFLKLNGKFCDKVDQIRNHGTAWGSTNFQSVIDEIIRVRLQRPDIPIEDYPKILLVVSDMQFDSVGSQKTNYERMMERLESVGLPKMTCIWWQVNGNYSGNVPNKMDEEGIVLVSGFDPAIVTSILGGRPKVVNGVVKELTAYESMVNALDQEILNMVVV